MGNAACKTDFTPDLTWYKFDGLYILYNLYKLH